MPRRFLPRLPLMLGALAWIGGAGSAAGQPAAAGAGAWHYEAVTAARRRDPAGKAPRLVGRPVARVLSGQLRPADWHADAAVCQRGPAAQPDRVFAVRRLRDPRPGGRAWADLVRSRLFRRILLARRRGLAPRRGTLGRPHPRDAGLGGAPGQRIPVCADSVQGGAIPGDPARRLRLSGGANRPAGPGAGVAGDPAGCRGARGRHDGGDAGGPWRLSLHDVSAGWLALERRRCGAGGTRRDDRTRPVGAGPRLRSVWLHLAHGPRIRPASISTSPT